MYKVIVLSFFILTDGHVLALLEEWGHEGHLFNSWLPELLSNINPLEI